MQFFVSNPKIESEVFTTDQMYIFAGDRLSLNVDNEITNEYLTQKTWIIREEGSGTRKITEQFLQRNNITPDRILTFGSTQIIKEVVEAGLGISLILEWAIKKEMLRGTVEKIPYVHTPVNRNFSIISIIQEFETKAVKSFKGLL